MGLTKNQRDRIKRLAAEAKRGHVELYRETSMSGQSETLRYRRQRIEVGRWGRQVRTESGMVLSVPINVLADGRDDPASMERYNVLCNEAVELFRALTSCAP
jgi:hypothetical protein